MIEPVPLGKPEQPTRFPQLLTSRVTQQATAALPRDILESLLISRHRGLARVRTATGLRSET
jgi:hypothetical protein